MLNPLITAAGAIVLAALKIIGDKSRRCSGVQSRQDVAIINRQMSVTLTEGLAGCPYILDPREGDNEQNLCLDGLLHTHW